MRPSASVARAFLTSDLPRQDRRKSLFTNAGHQQGERLCDLYGSSQLALFIVRLGFRVFRFVLLVRLVFIVVRLGEKTHVSADRDPTAGRNIALSTHTLLGAAT